LTSDGGRRVGSVHEIPADREIKSAGGCRTILREGSLPEGPRPWLGKRSA